MKTGKLLDLEIHELGIDMNAIKARILTEYEVDETQLTKDIQGLKEKLTELEFLDN